MENIPILLGYYYCIWIFARIGVAVIDHQMNFLDTIWPSILYGPNYCVHLKLNLALIVGQLSTITTHR
jgi:hypothetical protein